jgi:hypothetical protein
MDDAYVNSVRSSREKVVVLKTKVLKIRSAMGSVPVIVFEGVTDPGPYDVWFRRYKSDLKYIPVTANGKGHLMKFYGSLKNEEGIWKNLVYFIVDHDFDGLRGYEHSDIIFHTCTYSMENYLVSTDVLQSLLNDEFENPEGVEENINIIAHYESLLDNVCSALTDVNKRIFFMQNSNVGKGSKEEKIGKYIEISLSEVKKLYGDDDLISLVPLHREPTAEELDFLNDHFSKFEDLRSRFRGKYLYDFFLNIAFGRAELTHRSLASRVSGPSGLSNFVERIHADFSVATASN